MRTILVPAGGGRSDERIFATALAAARPLAAHLDFYHVQVGPSEAVANTPHAGFAMGPGLTNMLDQVWTTAVGRAAAARNHVEHFCRHHHIPLRDRPHVHDKVSASFCEAEGESVPLLIRRARHSDLVVIGRKGSDQLPQDFVERLLLQTGRPILLAPAEAASTLTGTVMVCWKECIQAAHAVTAAMPLLRKAQRVVIVGVAEDDDAARGDVAELAERMAWDGVSAEPLAVAANGRSAAQALLAAARDCAADLVVMGSYGHRRISEIIFGGCTEAFLRADERAVLLVH